MADPDLTRTRRPRNSLTVEGILDAAESVAAAGFDAITVRAVADELRSSPMALYRYFATKDELIDALLDRVLSRFSPITETDTPLADLEAFVRAHHTLLLAHPWAVAGLISRPLPGPHAVPIGEQALRILARAGHHADDAVAAFSGIIAFNYGWSSFEISQREPQGEVALGRIAQGVDARFPFTAAVAPAMVRYGAQEHYDWVLSALVRGIGTAPAGS